jgi:hypothetical protein
MKTTLGFQLTPVRIPVINKTNDGEDIGKMELSYTVGVN